MRRIRLAGTAAASVLLVLATLCGCAPSTPPRVSWHEVALPEGFVASRLVAVGGRLVVGGNTGESPALLVSSSADRGDSDRDGESNRGGGSNRDGTSTSTSTSTNAETLRPIPVHPVSFYGAISLWTTLVADGTTLYALGGRSGGGHGNPRWTTWAGGLDGITEQPAPGIEVFGGWRNGGVAGMAVAGGRPVIVGGRDNHGPGLDLAIWLHDGDEWVEQPSAGTALAATPGVLPFASGATGDGDRLLITGYAQHLGGGTVRIGAAVWVGSPGGTWRRVDLPADGARSIADAATCADGTCVVVGTGGGALLGWTLTGGSAHPLDLPPADVGDATVPAPVVWGDRIAIAAPDGDATALELADADHLDRFTTAAGPAGHPLALAVIGDRLALLTESADASVHLWLGDAH
ncbi:hypothetical protein QT381_14910 [Galbitalea sp. SE-J8]|uniref:hypothetical protein n=1 Tax=Galbitalea sp. SE-J8 TaxID=3054952 RepID=UPI00259D0099|nr:hypothetical protein [Galbitalea sp. SE-J8]MDM4764294.1 hypothetical protein [Galbitalea sp. SE-J8]